MLLLKVKDQPSNESSLLDHTKDGTILCQLANILKFEEDRDRGNFIKRKHSTSPFGANGTNMTIFELC